MCVCVCVDYVEVWSVGRMGTGEQTGGGEGLACVAWWGTRLRLRLRLRGSEAEGGLEVGGGLRVVMCMYGCFAGRRMYWGFGGTRFEGIEGYLEMLRP